MLQQFESIDKFLDKIGYKLLSMFGCGVYGCAYSIQNILTGKIRTLKLTSDSQEMECISKIIYLKAWEKTKHLPEIFKTSISNKEPIKIHGLNTENEYYLNC